MKYIVILGDGMADEPLEELGGKTPLEYAATASLDRLAPLSEIGMARTIPEGMKPGSDTANLAVLGYDPRRYYTGRSPLEALSIGIPMKDTDVALRCNLVTLSEEDGPYEGRTILDHSSGEIPTEEAAKLIEAAEGELGSETFSFHVGTSYRHLTIWQGGKVVDLVPPHDILGQRIGDSLPAEAALRDMMRKSYDILEDHPVNKERAGRGLRRANSLWFWGAGSRPSLDSFEGKFHKRGVMISAVDLLKGIATGAGMKVIEVEGANGTLSTNYRGKAMAAVESLLGDGYDFAYVHLEAPDEMGHQGKVWDKVRSIERLDEKIVGVVTEEMDRSGEEYRLLVLPDHPTPIRCRTHTGDPVPYLLYDSARPQRHAWGYSEREARESGNYIEEGYTLIRRLFQA